MDPPSDRAVPCVFEPVVNAAGAGVGGGQNWQLDSEGGANVRGGELGCLSSDEVAHFPVPDDHLGTRFKAKQNGDVVRHGATGYGRGRTGRQPWAGWSK